MQNPVLPTGSATAVIIRAAVTLLAARASKLASTPPTTRSRS
jgi:hypothetical protein